MRKKSVDGQSYSKPIYERECIVLMTILFQERTDLEPLIFCAADEL